MYEEYDSTLFEAFLVALVAFVDFLKEDRWRYSDQGEKD
jgi:hypothetical protein